ncbi:hypothetical protein LZ32DRAFT_598528 [Colletotrichum eremochloae]|nr:hypothetical protein LZ32DRAFT_598528 [Colletotrichum eremochloae]
MSRRPIISHFVWVWTLQARIFVRNNGLTCLDLNTSHTPLGLSFPDPFPPSDFRPRQVFTATVRSHFIRDIPKPRQALISS